MYENLLKAVIKLGTPRVLLVGDFMLDAYIYGDAERISPEPCAGAEGYQDRL